MLFNINLDIKEFIDSMKGSNSRGKYILQCIKYIKDNNINVMCSYDGCSKDEYERITKDDKDGENTNSNTV